MALELRPSFRSAAPRRAGRSPTAFLAIPGRRLSSSSLPPPLSVTPSILPSAIPHNLETLPPPFSFSSSACPPTSSGANAQFESRTPFRDAPLSLKPVISTGARPLPLRAFLARRNLSLNCDLSRAPHPQFPLDFHYNCGNICFMYFCAL